LDLATSRRSARLVSSRCGMCIAFYLQVQRAATNINLVLAYIRTFTIGFYVVIFVASFAGRRSSTQYSIVGRTDRRESTQNSIVQGQPSAQQKPQQNSKPDRANKTQEETMAATRQTGRMQEEAMKRAEETNKHLIRNRKRENEQKIIRHTTQYAPCAASTISHNNHPAGLRHIWFIGQGAARSM